MVERNDQGLAVPCSANSLVHPVAGKAAAAITTQGEGTYEQVFSLEMEKARAGKVKNTPWGSSFRAPPQVLHGALCRWKGASDVGELLHEVCGLIVATLGPPGYDRKVKGKTAEERLDMRAAMKADKVRQNSVHGLGLYVSSPQSCILEPSGGFQNSFYLQFCK